MAVLSHHRGAPAGGGLGPEAAFVLATAVLLDQGIAYPDLSVEQIARKAGRSRSTFYLYFRDKRDLLLRATEDIAERLYAAAVGWPSGAAGDADVRVAIAGMFAVYRDHRHLLAAVVEASSYDQRIRDHWRELMRRFVEATERTLLEQEKLVPEEPPRASARARAFALVWMIERASYQHLTGGGVEDDDALIDALAEIWQRGAGSAAGAPGTALAFGAPRVASPGRDVHQAPLASGSPRE